MKTIITIMFTLIVGVAFGQSKIDTVQAEHMPLITGGYPYIDTNWKQYVHKAPFVKPYNIIVGSVGALHFVNTPEYNSAIIMKTDSSIEISGDTITIVRRLFTGYEKIQRQLNAANKLLSTIPTTIPYPYFGSFYKQYLKAQNDYWLAIGDKRGKNNKPAHRTHLYFYNHSQIPKRK